MFALGLVNVHVVPGATRIKFAPRLKLLLCDDRLYALITATPSEFALNVHTPLPAPLIAVKFPEYNRAPFAPAVNRVTVAFVAEFDALISCFPVT